MIDREEELRRRIALMEAASEKRKHKRLTRTLVVLSVVCYALLLYLDGIPTDLKGILGFLVGGPFLAVLVFIAASLVLSYIDVGSFHENQAIARLKGRLDEVIRSKNDDPEAWDSEYLE